MRFWKRSFSDIWSVGEWLNFMLLAYAVRLRVGCTQHMYFGFPSTPSCCLETRQQETRPSSITAPSKGCENDKVRSSFLFGSCQTSFCFFSQSLLQMWILLSTLRLVQVERFSPTMISLLHLLGATTKPVKRFVLFEFYTLNFLYRSGVKTFHAIGSS